MYLLKPINNQLNGLMNLVEFCCPLMIGKQLYHRYALDRAAAETLGEKKATQRAKDKYMS